MIVMVCDNPTCKGEIDPNGCYVVLAGKHLHMVCYEEMTQKKPCVFSDILKKTAAVAVAAAGAGD